MSIKNVKVLTVSQAINPFLDGPEMAGFMAGLLATRGAGPLTSRLTTARRPRLHQPTLLQSGHAFRLRDDAPRTLRGPLHTARGSALCALATL